MTNETTYVEELAAWREIRDDFLANHYATPLSDEAISTFEGIQYFPADPSVVFEVRLEASDVEVAIVSSTGSTSDYPGAGRVAIPFTGGVVELVVLSGEEDDLFIPFRDGTSGDTTYSGGRYLAIEAARNGLVTVDFNKATNPYCAYDPDFSCPLPPQSNRLNFPVEAGEMDYS